MEKKKIISLTLALALSTGLLSGCSNKTQAHVSGDPSAIVVTDREQYLASNEIERESSLMDNQIDSFDKSPGSKEFDVGEHVFMVRYSYLESFNYSRSQNIDRLSITVPEGYEILSIENFSGQGYKLGTDQTYGTDVWYINNEKVLVQPIYNETFEHYDYSQPGVVIELTENEEKILGK